MAQRIGVVGAGQLALMMIQQCAEAGVHVSVLATSNDEPAAREASGVSLGRGDDLAALREFAKSVDVVTFDHELVDLAALATLESEGVVLRPSPAALRFAVDKAYQRRTLAEWGIPTPEFLIVPRGQPDDAKVWFETHREPPVVKAATGGYDGRGVAFPATRAETEAVCADWSSQSDLVLEERLILTSEVAQIGVRSVDATTVRYPVVWTRQSDGMCVETTYPCPLDIATVARVDELTTELLSRIEPVGVMAVEYFITDQGVLVNEVALRPHNTGHWTIEGTTAGQFVNHLRAVGDHGLIAPEVTAPSVTMVNVVGDEAPSDSSRAPTQIGLAVHDYGKAWRPGRKLGHVTAWGDDAHSTHVQAWEAARAFGTSTREAL